MPAAQVCVRFIQFKRYLEGLRVAVTPCHSRREAEGSCMSFVIPIFAGRSSLRFVDLVLALDRIIADLPTQPGLRQLSISLGLGETFMGGPAGEVAVQHQRFLRLAAAGVNVFVSSGDAGSNPDVTGHGTGPISQAEYESSDPSVVGVGGTRLT